jgi:hypothetical protein
MKFETDLLKCGLFAHFLRHFTLSGPDFHPECGIIWTEKATYARIIFIIICRPTDPPPQGVDRNPIIRVALHWLNWLK